MMAITAFSAPVLAENLKAKNVKTLVYTIDNTKEFYAPIFDAMTDLYKGTRYDKTKPYFEQPLVYIAQTDLNNDGVSEYIARPLEDVHEEGMFCVPNTSKCPHYVLTIADGVAKSLGVITANSVDAGEELVNGYKILKAFTMEDEGLINPKKFDFYETYKFDTKKDSYINAMVMPGEKIENKKAE